MYIFMSTKHLDRCKVSLDLPPSQLHGVFVRQNVVTLNSSIITMHQNSTHNTQNAWTSPSEPKDGFI